MFHFTQKNGQRFIPNVVLWSAVEGQESFLRLRSGEECPNTQQKERWNCVSHNYAIFERLLEREPIICMYRTSSTSAVKHQSL
jgi:hypothetical protein